MRRDLEKEVVGKRIKEVDVRPQRNAMRIIRRHARRKEFEDRLAGGKITKVDRRGKYILMFLDDGDVLIVHFGMSGQLLRGTKRQSLPHHTHVVIEFAAGRRPPLRGPPDLRRDVREPRLTSWATSTSWTTSPSTRWRTRSPGRSSPTSWPGGPPS